MNFKNEKLVTVVRYLLGLVLLVFGLNYFLKFMPMGEMPAGAGAFMGALMATGYMMPVVKVLEVAIGAMLLLNKKVPLALVLLVPLSVNFVLFHIFLAPAGGVPAYVIAVFNIYLIEMNWDNFKPLLE